MRSTLCNKLFKESIRLPGNSITNSTDKHAPTLYQLLSRSCKSRPSNYMYSCLSHRIDSYWDQCLLEPSPPPSSITPLPPTTKIGGGGADNPVTPSKSLLPPSPPLSLSLHRQLLIWNLATRWGGARRGRFFSLLFFFFILSFDPTQVKTFPPFLDCYIYAQTDLGWIKILGMVA